MKKLLASLFLSFATPALAVCPATPCYTLGIDGATDATGWTTFTPSPITSGSCAGGDANGTCIVRVATTGTDATCALVTPGTTPTNANTCATLNKGIALLRFRNGFPDWLLLRKGDAWTDQCFGGQNTPGQCLPGGDDWGLSGKSDNEPMVVGAYDPANPSVVNPPTGGAKPLLRMPSATHEALTCPRNRSACNRMAWVGLDIYAYEGDASVPGRATLQAGTAFQFAAPTTFLLIEDMSFRWWGTQHIGAPGPILGATYGGFYIRRNYFGNVIGSGIEAQVGQSGNGMTIAENFFDRNGAPTVTGTATITPGSTTLVNWPNGFPAGDRSIYVNGNQGFLTFSPGCAGITAGTQYWQYNNNFTTFNLSSSNSANVAVNSTGCTPTTQTVTWSLLSPFKQAFNHQMYLGNNARVGYNTDPTWQLGQITVRGNVFANANDSQYRMGGLWTDNLTLGHTRSNFIGNPTPGNNSTFSNNVLLNMTTEGVVSWTAVTSTYQGDSTGIGSTTFTNNLFIQSPTATFAPIQVGDGHTVSYSNNIAYSWPSPTLFFGRSGAITAIKNLVGGTGYTDSTPRTISSIYLPGPIEGFVGLSLNADSPPLFVDFVWVTGIHGAGCVLNDKLWGVRTNQGSNQIELQGATSFANCTNDGSGLVYYSNGGGDPPPPFAFSGGTGSGATAHFISVGGVVKAVLLQEIDSINGAATPQPGFGYTVNDQITVPTLPHSGGTPMSFDVAAVSAVTDGGNNKFCPNGASSSGCGAGTFPNPTANIGAYMDQITGTGGHTAADYSTALQGQSKANWNPLLWPITGTNPYFRAAFGLGKSFTITNP